MPAKSWWKLTFYFGPEVALLHTCNQGLLTSRKDKYLRLPQTSQPPPISATPAKRSTPTCLARRKRSHRRRQRSSTSKTSHPLLPRGAQRERSRRPQARHKPTARVEDREHRLAVEQASCHSRIWQEEPAFPSPWFGREVAWYAIAWKRRSNRRAPACPIDHHVLPGRPHRFRRRVASAGCWQAESRCAFQHRRVGVRKK